MNPYTQTGVLILCVVIATLSLQTKHSLGSSKKQDKEAIQGIVREFVRAWNHDDANALVELFVKDGELDTPREAEAESRSAIRKLLTQDREELFQESSLKKDIRKIRFQGENRATVEGHYSLAGIEPGMGLVEVSVQGTYIFFLEKHHGAWFIKKCDIRQSDS
ncbi:SgcJ/EcaC family oxidoreductase [Candidatus Nitronereus thalassa]|uniref:SgcJ/EcaC family oxidoreductase n=1 Tax=Candidatus Nitronereus thalassa TaxID=3020898 RepID=A0ABU3KBH5_9BACT|nr:SgcJ/EcaC family oxidoreductase [Candidatus Nitronereus thalassa]MDT7043762.1 SgcJ/EcaC family oxidoreductase [Candidatus Nitronereus thalassa]